MIRPIIAEALCPRTWIEAICINVFVGGLILLAFGFGG